QARYQTALHPEGPNYRPRARAGSNSRALCLDFVARPFDGAAHRMEIDSRWIVCHARQRLVQADIGLRDARQRFQYTRDACNAAATAHPLHIERNCIHDRVSLRAFTLATASTATHWRRPTANSPPSLLPQSRVKAYHTPRSGST